MRGIQLGIIGVCVSLTGIAFAMNDFIAICASFAGTLLAVAGFLVKGE